MKRKLRIEKVYEKYFEEQTRELLDVLQVPHNPATNLVCMRKVLLHSHGEDFVGLLLGKEASQPPRRYSTIEASLVFRVYSTEEDKPVMVAMVKDIKPVDCTEKFEPDFRPIGCEW